LSYRKLMTKPEVHTTIRQKRKKKNNISLPHSNNIHQLYNTIGWLKLYIPAKSDVWWEAC
jgi:hypothetical protein